MLFDLLTLLIQNKKLILFNLYTFTIGTIWNRLSWVRDK